MVKRRKLGDLYVTGKELEIDDGQGAVTVWMQKLNAFEHEQVLRRAAAARAAFLSYKSDPDSPEYKLAHGDAQDFGGREVVIDFLMQNDLVKAQISAEAEIGAEDEWSEDDYLQGLTDAWQNGMQAAYAVDKEDVEAKRVYTELKRYADAVDAAVEAERVGLRRDYDEVSLEELEKDAAKRFLERRGDQQFVTEYTRSEIFMATRLPEDHRRRYFDNREDLDMLATEVLAALEDGYNRLAVDSSEGKDLPSTPPSSDSSEQPERADQAAPSGLSVVSQ